jgi:hypothetical protein
MTRYAGILAMTAALAMPAFAAPPAGLVGTWRGEAEGAPVELQLRADGTGSYNGEAFQYAVMGERLVVSANGEAALYVFRLQGDSLAVAGGTLAAPLQLARAAPGAKPPAAKPPAASAGGVRQELAGKWCYFASSSALSGGGSMSSECFVLHPNGTYEFSSERSMSAYGSGTYGGTASQSSDRGRWSATDASITAHSQSGTATTYRLKKVNHPKNRDPMLCIDDRCYVTYYRRAPW